MQIVGYPMGWLNFVYTLTLARNLFTKLNNLLPKRYLIRKSYNSLFMAENIKLNSVGTCYYEIVGLLSKHGHVFSNPMATDSVGILLWRYHVGALHFVFGT